MYQVNKNKMFVDIADNMAIIINSEIGIYYGVNNFGTSVFECLLKGASTTTILNSINKIQSVPADMAQRLDTFIETLTAKEILIEGADCPPDAIVPDETSLNLEFAVADNFNLEVQEFYDARELLLADPIHDVDEEAGWQPILNK